MPTDRATLIAIEQREATFTIGDLKAAKATLND